MGVQLSPRRIGQKCIYGVTKAAIILAVILIDLLVLTGGLALSGFFVASFLSTVVDVIAFGYAICGNIVTYNVIKYSLLNLKHIIKYYNSSNKVATSLHKKPGWDGVKNATRGRLALTGSAIYLLIVLFGFLIYIVTEFGIRESSMYSLVLMGISFATTFGIIPLINYTERLSKKTKQK
ncbi:MAG TPA: hypothetical protein VLD84_03210 [Nitrososphaeraceae archaeon]|nr:hypothetical protein [Nitrososphaeraceae archaeon]